MCIPNPYSQCSFCGSTNVKTRRFKDYVAVECQNCKARGPHANKGAYDYEAINLWNKHLPDEPLIKANMATACILLTSIIADHYKEFQSDCDRSNTYKKLRKILDNFLEERVFRGVKPSATYKAEAYKEFADRLKEKCGNTELANYILNKLLKEMVGEDNE